MVSIAAFQAVDPGSIPGWRNFIFLSYPFPRNRKLSEKGETASESASVAQ